MPRKADRIAEAESLREIFSAFRIDCGLVSCRRARAKNSFKQSTVVISPPERPPEAADIRFDQSEHPVWTENKAKLIEQYLYLFVLLTKHGTYIDGFAGPQRPENPEMWSAKLVLESKPQRLRNIFLFDKSIRKVRLLCRLRKAQAPVPGRVIRIFHGDFNTRVRQLLRRSKISQMEATFCLLDQWTFQCHWSTLIELSEYKGEGKPKIELFYFLAVRWLKRALKAVQRETILRQWWGRDDWPTLKNLKPRANQKRTRKEI